MVRIIARKQSPILPKTFDTCYARWEKSALQQQRVKHYRVRV